MSATMRPWANTRDAYRSACYTFQSVREERMIQKFYCSAAVLPYAVIKPSSPSAGTFGDHHDQLLRWMTDTPGDAGEALDDDDVVRTKVVFLLGGEVRRDKRAPARSVDDQDTSSDLFWSDFGGKREAHDKSFVQTAFREFNEETAGLFASHSASILDQMHSLKSLKVWHGAGFSVLFLVEVPYLPNASAQFYELFTHRVAAVRAEVEAKLELSRRGEVVAVSKELMGTMNKCAVRWVPKEDFIRLFTVHQGDKSTPCCLTFIEWTTQPAPPTPHQATTTTTTTPSPEPSAFTMQIYPYFLGYFNNFRLRQAIANLHDTPPARPRSQPQTPAPAEVSWRQEMEAAEREQEKAMAVVSEEEAELLKKLADEEAELLKKMEEEQEQKHDPASAASWWW